MNISVTLSDAEAQALSLAVVDPAEWLQNAATARAASAQAEIVTAEAYRLAMVSAAGAGIDPGDEAAVIAHGLSNGMIETAAQRAAAAVE